MSAFQHRAFELDCDAPGCRQGFRGATGTSRAALRKSVAKRGWTHVRSDSGRNHDKDYCPAHKAEAEEAVAQRGRRDALRGAS